MSGSDVIFMTNEEVKHLVDSIRHNQGEDGEQPSVPGGGAQAATIGATTRSPFFASFLASVQNAREAQDVTCGADSASSTRHEIKEASFDHARYSQSIAGASQHLLEDEMSQAETTVRTAEPSRSRMWSEAVPGDETAGESEGEAFFDDVITCQIAGLADDDLDEAGEFDDIPDVPVLEPELLKPVTSRTGTHGVQAPADAQKTAGALRSAQAAAGSSKGGNHWQFSPAAARAQEECLGTSQAMLDAQFALEYGAGLRE